MKALGNEMYVCSCDYINKLQTVLTIENFTTIDSFNYYLPIPVLNLYFKPANLFYVKL